MPTMELPERTAVLDAPARERAPDRARPSAPPVAAGGAAESRPLAGSNMAVYLPWVDLLRFVACVLVIYSHASLAALFRALGTVDRRFLVYIDDLGFEDGDSTGPRQLRSWLEGGVEARPANVRLAVTANRRAIVARHLSEQDDPINPRDVVDDRLALADRFGLSVGFHACSQDDYLAIIAGYAAEYGLAFAEGDALEWSKRRGARSGRVAWQYVTELAGRAGQAL